MIVNRVVKETFDDSSPTWPLVMTLALTGVAAAVATAARKHPELASIFGRLFFVLSSYASFVWYCRDSDMRSYSRSMWRNIGFIFVGLLFIPWYLVRTRSRGKRLFALLKLAAFTVLIFIAILLGAFVGFFAEIPV